MHTAAPYTVSNICLGAQSMIIEIGPNMLELVKALGACIVFGIAIVMIMRSS